VVAYERVSLYGLPIVEGRKVHYHRIHPEEARSIFIRSALVEGEIQGSYGFLDHNRKLIEQIEEIENMTRRRDLLVDEEKSTNSTTGNCRILPMPGRWRGSSRKGGTPSFA